MLASIASQLATACVSTRKGRNLLRKITRQIDIDNLDDAFFVHAGDDEELDKSEFDALVLSRNLSVQQARDLWRVLDKDGSGVVSKAEFKEAFMAMLQARQWMRYCPACDYSNTCAFCDEVNAQCKDCTDKRFCAKHWAEHPVHHEQTPLYDPERIFGLEYVRDRAVVRPLVAMYNSPTARAVLPTSQLAVVRRQMRHQILQVVEGERREQEREAAARNRTYLAGLEADTDYSK